MTGQLLLFALLLLSWKLDVVGGDKSLEDKSIRNNPSTSFPTTSPSDSPSTLTSHSDSPSTPTSHSVSSSTPTSHSSSSSIPSSPSDSPSTPTSHSVSSSTPTSHSSSSSIPPSHSDSPPTPTSHNGSSSTSPSHSSSSFTPTSHTSWSFSSTPPKDSSPNPSTSFGTSSAVTSMATPDKGSTNLGISASSGETQRNPGVVIVVCLFVSILILGSVMVAVKCFRKNINSFQKMDELPMVSASEITLIPVQ